MTGLLNHLWQSTLFAAVAAVAAYACKTNSAKLRYWFWLAASLKFLIPFSMLVSLGTRVEMPSHVPVVPALAVNQITASFAPVPLSQTTFASSNPVSWTQIAGLIWLSVAALLLLRWGRRAIAIRSLVRSGVHLPVAGSVAVVSARSNIEPGVFGIFKPVLLLPEGIVAGLPAGELEAILAHELEHVRRRDNLTAALHMLVEAVFWFHPLVWWIGARIVDERERACDEAVLGDGGAAKVYASGIVNVCKFYLDSPLACASGVSGGELKKRIEAIMTWRPPMRLTFARTLALLVAGVAVIAAPVALGILRAQVLPPPPQYKFEVASIRPGDPNARNEMFRPGPQGGLLTENTTTLHLITFAYDIPEFELVGGPSWIKSERFNIVATPDQPEEALNPKLPHSKFEAQIVRQRQRMQSLLRDRFGLVLRVETRDQPLYSVTIAKGGSKLSAPGDAAEGPSMRRSRGGMTGVNVYLKLLINALASELGRPVVNETGLEGPYDFKLEWSPDAQPAGAEAAADTSGPSLFTALQEQLGLKLESKRGPAPVYVIEKIEKPSAN